MKMDKHIHCLIYMLFITINIHPMEVNMPGASNKPIPSLQQLVFQNIISRQINDTQGPSDTVNNTKKIIENINKNILNTMRTELKQEIENNYKKTHWRVLDKLVSQTNYREGYFSKDSNKLTIFTTNTASLDENKNTYIKSTTLEILNLKNNTKEKFFENQIVIENTKSGIFCPYDDPYNYFYNIIIATSPNKQWLAIPRDKHITIHKTTLPQKPLYTISKPSKLNNKHLLKLAISCNGKKVAVGYKNEIYLGNVEDKKFTSPIQTEQKNITKLTFIPHQPNIIVICGNGDNIEVWNTRLKQRITTLPYVNALSPGDDGPFTNLIAAVDNPLLIATTNYRGDVWDTQTWEKVMDLGHGLGNSINNSRRVDISPNGEYIFVPNQILAAIAWQNNVLLKLIEKISDPQKLKKVEKTIFDHDYIKNKSTRTQQLIKVCIQERKKKLQKNLMI